LPPAWLPADDFPTFRAASRGRLSPIAWTWVDERYGVAARETAGWLAERTDGPLSEDLVVQRLQEVYEGCATIGELLVATRAAQAVLFRAGWLLQIDLARFMGMAPSRPRRAQRTPALWRRARIYRQPHRGATAALAGAGLSLEEMGALRVSDVAADGASVLVAGEHRDIEAGAWQFVRAQLLMCAWNGQGPDAAFLTQPLGEPLPERALADLLTVLRTETGLALTPRLVPRKRLASSHWFLRWGLSLQPLKAAGQ
jgi:hypothetical protein